MIFDITTPITTHPADMASNKPLGFPSNNELEI